MKKIKSLPKLKAQSILEYSILVGCVVAAFVAMQIYVKRGVEGRLKQTADEIGEQYASENTTADITTNLTSTQTMVSEQVPLGRDDTYGLPMLGIKTTVTINNETMTRSGSEKLGKFEDTLFKKR